MMKTTVVTKPTVLLECVMVMINKVKKLILQILDLIVNFQILNKN